MFPAGLIGWAKSAYTDLDPDDQSMWWIPRLIGSGFIAMSLFWIKMIAFH
jgi:hypothetical protein